MNKPVAWMDAFGDLEKFNHNNNKDWIPLYTHPAPTKVKFASNSCESGWIYLENAHPVKELTDEEIMDVCITGGIYDCINDPYMQKDGKYSLDIDLIRFAKAILRKAQEK